VRHIIRYDIIKMDHRKVSCNDLQWV